MRRALLPRTALLALLGATAFACTVMNGLSADPIAPDAGPEAAAPVCVPHRPPAKPAGTSAGDDPKNDILVALIKLVDATPDAPQGFDLDGLCTCAPDGPACRSSQPTCDLDGGGGRDNAITAMLASARAFGPGLDLLQYANGRLSLGYTGYLIQVTDYNGLSDDPAVTVSVYGSGGPLDAEGARELPLPERVQRWGVVRKHLASDAGELRSRFVTREGYVSGGTLVATFDFPFIIAAGAPYERPFEGATLTAAIAVEEGRPMIRLGSVAGAWPVSALYRYAEQVVDPNTTKPFCLVSDFRTIATAALCPATDLVASPGAPPDARCDAVSFGLGFTATPAEIWGSVDVEEGPNPCSTPEFSCPE